MKRIVVLLSAATAVCSLLSCRKELEEVNPTPTAATTAASRPLQLAAGAWHQTGLQVSTTGADKQVVKADLFAHVSPGLLVQQATFGADGSYSVLKGGANAQAKQGRWQLNAANDSITLTLPDQVRRLAVAELTPTSLVLSYTDGATNGSVSTYTSTFAH